MKSLSKKQLAVCLFFSISISLVFGCGKKNISTPVQFEYSQTAGCLVTSDFYAIYFSAYIKPDNDLENIKGKARNEFLRSYCKEIPRSGSLYFTADLADEDTRELPIGVRIVKQELIGEDDKDAENFRDIATIVEVPVKLYPKGMIETQVDLSEEGYYALYLTIGDQDALTEDSLLRIPMNIGADPDIVPAWQRIFTVISILLGIVIAIGMGLILFSPILPIQQWVNTMTKIFFIFRFKQGVNNASKY